MALSGQRRVDARKVVTASYIGAGTVPPIDRPAWAQGLTLWDDFALHPDGPLAGRAARSGHVWSRVTGGIIAAPTVSGKKLIAPSAAPSTTAAYAVADLGQTITKMRARISFAPGVANGSPVLIVSKSFNPNGPDYITTDGALHMSFRYDQCTIGFFVPGGGGTQQFIAAFNYADMATDGTQYDVGFDLAGTTATFYGPGGVTQQRTDQRFVDLAGRYATFEHYYPSGSAIPTFHGVGAS